MRSVSLAALLLSGAAIFGVEALAGEPSCDADDARQEARGAAQDRQVDGGRRPQPPPVRERSVADELYGRPASATL